MYCFISKNLFITSCRYDYGNLVLEKSHQIFKLFSGFIEFSYLFILSILQLKMFNIHNGFQAYFLFNCSKTIILFLLTYFQNFVSKLFCHHRKRYTSNAILAVILYLRFSRHRDRPCYIIEYERNTILNRQFKTLFRK